MTEPALRASCLPLVQGEHERVTLAALLPLVEWRFAGELAEFKIHDHRRPRPRADGEVDLVVLLAVRDSRYDPTKPAQYGYGPDRNVETSDAEALLVCAPDYATVDEALEQFRKVARLLVLHEVDETLRFAGMLPFDPHTKDRERNFPPTEDLP